MFLVLLAIGLRSSEWRDRLGWITNPWIISVMWLGIGLVFSILLITIGIVLFLDAVDELFNPRLRERS